MSLHAVDIQIRHVLNYKTHRLIIKHQSYNDKMTARTSENSKGMEMLTKT